ncbi:DUF5518 domain-containing protein [Halovenus salina]|uniref:DUF5518 domain-containing protein n=1 Tax=Halovenus salina TaxID=1510225 RepID=UPI00226099DC|nr:DUF5518 domain-containing protein [Halovenus salina]
MNQTEFEPDDEEGQSTERTAIPEVIDWLLGMLIAIVGLLLLFAGTVLTTALGREELGEAVDESGPVTVGTTELTRTEAIDVGAAVVSWVGLGMLVAGLGLVALAVAFVYVRHRDNSRQQRGEPTSSYYANAIRGGVVTAFFSFVGISAVVGGALAGYLEGGGSDRTTTVGAVAGLLPALPALVIGLFTVVGLYSGLQDIGQTGPMVAGVGGILFGVLIYAGFNATLGALGGYVGGRLAE